MLRLPIKNIFESGTVRLEKQDLILFEPYLKESLSGFLNFKSYSLYFPQGTDKTGETKGGEPLGRGRAIYYKKEGRLLLPLCAPDGEVLAIFAARGVKPDIPKNVLPYLETLAGNSLEKLILLKSAVTDPLTGLISRKGLIELVENEITRIQNSLTPTSGGCLETPSTGFSGCFAVLLVDVNRFKRLNEKYGHSFGDEILKGVARVLQANRPEQSVQCRLEKDCFAVFWPGATPHKCARLAKRLLSELNAVSLVHGETGERVMPGFSIGYANYPQDLRGRQFVRSVPEQAKMILDKASSALETARSAAGEAIFGFRDILREGGKIISALPMNTVTISLGREVGTEEGHRFLVWPRKTVSPGRAADSAGSLISHPQIYKGEIIVTEAGEDSSTAEILYLNDPAATILPGDMLVHHPESEAIPEPAPSDESLTRDALTGLYSYRDFLKFWSGDRRNHPEFAIFIVLMIEPGEKPEGAERPERLIPEAASVIRRILGPACAGGRYGSKGAVFYLPGCSQTQAAELLPRMEETIRERIELSPVIGCACYPCLSFNKADILENARLAVEHAAMLPDGKIALFDSISLTIAGDRLFSQGDVYGAIEEYKTALLADENNLLATNSLGICFARLGKAREAVRLFEAALGQSSENVAIIYNYAYALNKLGEIGKAKAAFEKCLALDPEHVFSLLRLGRIAEAESRPDIARACYERISRIPKGAGLSYKHLARIAIAAGETDQARDYLHQALLFDPFDAFSMYMLAQLYLESGEDTQIVETLARNALDLRPDRPEFRELISRAAQAKSESVAS